MKTKLLSLMLSAGLVLSLATQAHAIEDPLKKPNNSFGIHILFDTELEQAARLVNSNGGEWGYVVIPIQRGDRDIVKWQQFMDKAKELKVIPIVRLATENYYFNTKVWRTPTEQDILDFVNFLDSLAWPVKNRYIIVFNEVNRDDEWGGSANPEEYAKLLSYTTSLFKSRSDDYFIISAGLDNASINGNGATNQFDFVKGMHRGVPGIFNQIDGISSHSYPNPGFSSPPTASHQMSIASFRFERSLVESLSTKKLPIFITETGWSSDVISDDLRARYYQVAFSDVWSDPGIVTVAPFLLSAGGGPFEQFTFLKGDGSFTKQYEVFQSFKKTKGMPTIIQGVLGSDVRETERELPIKSFTSRDEPKKVSRTEAALFTFDFLFAL